MKSARNYLQEPYARIVIPIEGSGFHGEIFEFPGCFAQGTSVEEAYANLEKAAESWIEACLSSEQEVPEPYSNVTFSGRIALRLPRSVHRKATQMAERDRSSLNTYIVSAVSAKVGAEDFYGLLAQRLEQRLVTTVSQLAKAAFFFYKDYLEGQSAHTPPTATRKIGGEIDRLPIQKTASTEPELMKNMMEMS